MLILSRKLNEHIRIGQDISITIVEIDRGRVRLGIIAPRDVIVLRSELLVHSPKEDSSDAAGSQEADSDDHGRPDSDLQV